MTSSLTMANSLPVDNNYQITVSATEMRAGANAPLPAKRTDIALTVIVGNVDDPVS